MYIKDKKCFCQSSTCIHNINNICEKCNLPIVGTSICDEYEGVKSVETKAHWIKASKVVDVFICSNCMKSCDTSEYEYCPHCGCVISI